MAYRQHWGAIVTPQKGTGTPAPWPPNPALTAPPGPCNVTNQGHLDLDSAVGTGYMAGYIPHGLQAALGRYSHPPEGYGHPCPLAAKPSPNCPTRAMQCDKSGSPGPG